MQRIKLLEKLFAIKKVGKIKEQEFNSDAENLLLLKEELLFLKKELRHLKKENKKLKEMKTLSQSEIQLLLHDAERRKTTKELLDSFSREQAKTLFDM